MKSTINFVSNRLLYFGTSLLAACLFAAASARGGLTVDIHLFHDSYGYYFYPYLSTNTVAPDFPAGVYRIASWQYPTNGSANYYHTTPTSFDFGDGNGNYGGGSYYQNFDSVLYGITNQPWSILVANSTSTNFYQFTVSVTGLTSNDFGAPPIPIFPAGGATFVTNQPTFAWTGPANWAGTLSVEDDSVDSNGYYYYVDSASLSSDATTWTPSAMLPDGTNAFSVNYSSNATALIVASTPTNGAAQPIAGWISTATLQCFFANNVLFTVGQLPVVGGGGHTNIAHYAFEDGSDTYQLGVDSSPNGNDLNGYSYWGPVHTNNADAAAGTNAVEFFGNSSMNANDQVLTNLNAVLAGSFTFSVWVKTTASRGNDSDNAYFGATIFWAFNDIGGTNDAIPLAITGGKAAFTTRDHLGNFDTLHSTTSVNDGNYHLITVTRDQATGEKKIYVDGNFEASEFGTTDPLNGNNYYLNVGGTTSSSYTGLLDDLQIYSGVLSSNEVMQLYNSPGTTIPDMAASSGNGPDAHYDFDEGTALAPDVSGNGNDIVYAGAFSGSGPTTDSDAIAGSGSVSFDGGSYLTATNRLLSTLAGSFSVSLWVNTVQDTISNPEFFDAAGIVAADIPGGYNDMIPIGMDEYGEIVFNTGNTDQGYDDEMYSYTTVNDGSWHHIVVTRDQTTGEKNIYIDGVLDDSSPDYGTTNLLSDPVLLTIGALADASDSDPTSPDSTGINGYEGLLDDIQIYNRVLTSNEVDYLYNHPGKDLTPQTNNLSISFTLNIVRNQTDASNDEYYCFPSLDSISPTPITTDEIHSPNDLFSCDQNGGGSDIEYSLGSVLDECTNGLWTLYINRGDSSQQQFTFRVSISGLTTNLLKPVVILSPANGSEGVSATPPYDWTGPEGFDGIFVQLRHTNSVVASDNLSGTATNWVYNTPLNPGTNTFYLNYNVSTVTNITFTTPVDVTSAPLFSWTAKGGLDSEATSQFVVSSNAPVQLVNVQRAGGNVQFSFETQNGLSHTIEVSTNLASGVWTPVTNFSGDGSLKQFAFPVTNAPTEFFRVRTQ